MVILDNGHGVDTPGKRSPLTEKGELLFEYKWTREVVLLIHLKLDKLHIANTILVPEEKDISLKERVNRANKIYKDDKNSFLISVHINAAGNGSWANANGWSVFISKNASLKSKNLAKIFFAEADKLKLFGNRSIPLEHYWTWNWTTNDIYILKNSNCPAILTENMFMDNRKDMEFLMKNKELFANLHVKAIQKYLELK